MASNIPKPLQNAIELFANLSDSGFDRLVAGLASKDYFQSHGHLADTLMAQFDSEIDSEQASNLASFLLAFAHRSGQPNERSIQDTGKSLVRDLDLNELESSTILERFVTLVSIGSLVGAASAAHAERRGARLLDSFEASSSLQSATPAEGDDTPLFSQQSLLTIRHSPIDSNTSETITLITSVEELRYIASKINEAIETTETSIQQLRSAGVRIWMDSEEK